MYVCIYSFIVCMYFMCIIYIYVCIIIILYIYIYTYKYIQHYTAMFAQPGFVFYVHSISSDTTTSYRESDQTASHPALRRTVFAVPWRDTAGFAETTALKMKTPRCLQIVWRCVVFLRICWEIGCGFLEMFLGPQCLKGFPQGPAATRLDYR